MRSLPPGFRLSEEVGRALHAGAPVVALESTVITHGLPRPENLDLARDMEAAVREGGAVPATIAILEGQVRIGLSEDELQALARADDLRKISLRDFGAALAGRASGGVTVAATLLAARGVGLRVFATGGIGGVHRHSAYDVSADLQQLGRTPMVVVCAGAKAILDLPATLERLETLGVPVVGYGTDRFPAFYTRESGLPVPVRVESTAQVVALASAHWRAGLESAVLVTVPPPKEVALPKEVSERAIERALEEAEAAGVTGPLITPFLLERVSARTGGASLQANLGLLRNNARVAAAIAAAFAARERPSA